MAFTLLVEHVEHVSRKDMRDIDEMMLASMTWQHMIWLSYLFAHGNKAGCNMRRIADSCNAKAFSPFLLHHEASNESGWSCSRTHGFQVRLRGNGSGFLEGSHKLEAGHWWPFWEALLSASQLNFQADMPLQLHVSCTDYADYAPALVTMSTWLRGCACTGAMAIGLFFVGVCQKYCQEKLEFILSATKAAAVRQVGCPKIEDVAPLVHSTSYFHWISHLKLTFGKCWMFPREQFCFGPSTESTGPAISHLKAAHYPGSVGARRYARSKGIEIPDAEALKCRHFCIASEALVVNWILNIYISHHITYLIVDFLQYSISCQHYDLRCFLSRGFFAKQYVYLVWCFSVSSLLFFLHGKNTSNSLRGQIGPRRGKTWWLEH